jgi:hypothetical protein
MASVVPFDRKKIAQTAVQLAAKGVFIGTSSWKYPGWCGMLYNKERYAWRGKFAESRFNDGCLAEYAETLKTVCIDAALGGRGWLGRSKPAILIDYLPQ